LQIDRNVILRGPNIVPNTRNMLQSRNCKKRFAPRTQISGMHPIHERPLERARPAPRSSGRAQQFSPPFLDQPSDLRAWKGVAQSLRGGERVNDVTHGAQTHDENSLDIRTAVRSRAQGFLGESRERMISLVE
jgi:hypothetical protein